MLPLAPRKALLRPNFVKCLPDLSPEAPTKEGKGPYPPLGGANRRVTPVTICQGRQHGSEHSRYPLSSRRMLPGPEPARAVALNDQNNHDAAARGRTSLAFRRFR